MLFDLFQNSDTSGVTTTGAHNERSNGEFDGIFDLICFEVDFDGVVDLDLRVRVTQSTSVVGGDERDSFWSELSLLDLAELVLKTRY